MLSLQLIHLITAGLFTTFFVPAVLVIGAKDKANNYGATKKPNGNVKPY